MTVNVFAVNETQFLNLQPRLTQAICLRVEPPYSLDAVLKIPLENFLKFVNPDVHVTNLNFILTNLIVIVRI